MNNQLLKSLKVYFNFYKSNNEDNLIITFFIVKIYNTITDVKRLNFDNHFAIQLKKSSDMLFFMR